MIYLDYNATAPLDPRVADAMRPYRCLAWIWISVVLLLMASGTARSSYAAPG